MIKDEIVTYEVAKLARAKGFNEGCLFYYQNGVTESDGCYNHYNLGAKDIYSAPTQSLLQRWLREEKGIHITLVSEPTITTDSNMCYQWSVNWDSDGIYYDTYCCSEEEYPNYELALEDALKHALENLI